MLPLHAIIIVALATLLSSCAVAEKKNRPVALVIGNGAYGGEIPTLPNPEHDARAVAERMRSNGFTTILLLDAKRDEMLRTLQTFGQLASGAPLAAVYYSGHGVEIAGRNLLLPIDFKVDGVSNPAALQERAVSLAELGALVSGRADATLIILDACRTDPTLPATVETRTRRLPPIAGMGVGLGGETLPAATVVYATEPGKTAIDGQGEFSPFTTSVLQLINQPANLGDRRGRVSPFLPLLRMSVVDLTHGVQTPTWRGPELPAMYGYNPTPAPPVQQILTASTPAPTETTFVGELSSTPVRTFSGTSSICTAESRWASGTRLTTLTTSENGPLCGDMLGSSTTTAKVIRLPQHGRLLIGDKVYAYVPNAGFVGTDAFTLSVFYPGGADNTRWEIQAIVEPRPTR